MSFPFADQIAQSSKMLGNLDAWLRKARTHAETKEFPPENLLSARLAPDQHPLVAQVQMACDAAKFLVARLAGVSAPAHADEETSFEQLHQRIAAVREYLAGFGAAQLDGAASRMIELPYLPSGHGLLGRDYVCEAAMPNFMFHVVTAYAILRHNGVELGKRDFIGSINLQTLDGD